MRMGLSSCTPRLAMHDVYIGMSQTSGVAVKLLAFMPDYHGKDADASNHLFKQIALQVAINVAPQKWWQHAVHAVLKERRRLQSSDATKLSFATRQHLQRQYTRLYRRHRQSKSW